MKKITLFFACISMLIFSCTEKKVDTPVEEPAITLPMEVSYPGKPTIGSWDNVKTVMEWNKRLSEMNTTDLGELLADSVTIHLADGTEFDAPRDTIVNIVKSFIGELSSLDVKFTAAIPVDNVDQNDEWVFSWTEETTTYKDERVAHTFIQEDYRLVGGKIREVFQYARKEAAKK